MAPPLLFGANEPEASLLFHICLTVVGGYWIKSVAADANPDFTLSLHAGDAISSVVASSPPSVQIWQRTVAVTDRQTDQAGQEKSNKQQQQRR